MESYKTMPIHKLIEIADSGDDDLAKSWAIYRLECMMEDKEEPDINERILRYLNELIDSGHHNCYLQLADKYRHGSGVLKDINKTVELVELAVEKGAEHACEFLGQMYYKGEGVPQSYTKAMELFEREDEDTDLMVGTRYSMAEIYRLGLTGVKDLDKAWDLYEDIVYDPIEYAKLDDCYSRACFRLAQILQKSEDEEDIQEAYRLLQYSMKKLLNRAPTDVPTGISEEEFKDTYRVVAEKLEG